MMKRNKSDMKMAILYYAKTTKKPTRLMYKANLSWTTLIAGLEALIREGLMLNETRQVKIRQGENKGLLRRKERYIITAKGTNALEKYIQTKELLGEPLADVFAAIEETEKYEE